MKANKEAIESLAPRVNFLAESLCAPTSEDDIREKSRRSVLEQWVRSLPSRGPSLTTTGYQKAERLYWRTRLIEKAKYCRGILEQCQECGKA